VTWISPRFPEGVSKIPLERWPLPRAPCASRLPTRAGLRDPRATPHFAYVAAMPPSVLQLAALERGSRSRRVLTPEFRVACRRARWQRSLGFPTSF